MNEVLIRNWNERIRKEDTVYHLGDFGFGDYSKILKRLNGNITLIRGSHDKYLSRYWNIEKVKDLLEIKIDNQIIVLCHYSMQSWPKSYHGSWHLFGHSHGKLKGIGRSFDVGVDSNDYKPLSWEDVKHKMKGCESFELGRPTPRNLLASYHLRNSKFHMPLFVCEKCGCVENSALSDCSWIEYLNKRPMLCSECCPGQEKWHGKFSKKKWDHKEEVMNRENV